MEDGTVNVRRYGQKQTHTEAVSEFVENVLADIARKSRPMPNKRAWLAKLTDFLVG